MNAPTTVAIDLSYGVEKFHNVIPVGDDFDYAALAKQHKLVIYRYNPDNEEKYGGMGFIQYWPLGWERMHYTEVKKLTIGLQNRKPVFIKPEGFTI